MMLATPVMAQTQTVQNVRSAQSGAPLMGARYIPARAGSPMSEENKLAGNSLWIIGAVALAAGVTWAIVDDDDDDEESPVSP